jgi:putative phosphoribosyl transferase
MALFRDRAEAARDLAPLIPPEIGPDWLLLALPRGGVPIAAVLARLTGARFDILIVRKVGAPGNPELALAAVTGPEPGQMVVNEGLQQMLGLSHAQVTAAAAPELAEIARRRKLWSADAPVALAGRKVAIVDDGAATGTTLRAAIAAARAQGAGRIAVILPVGLGASLQGLPADVGPVICPHPAASISAVGQAYERFPQVEDAEVARLLAARAD